MMRLLQFKASIVLLVLVLSSCGYANMGCIDGTGNIVKNERNLDEFDKIVIKGSSDVYLKQGANQSVTVETDDNIMEHIITDVDGGTLTITTENSVCPEKLNLYITISDLSKIEIKGSGDVHGEGMFKTEDLELLIKGSGDIKLDVTSNNTSCSVKGSGDMQLNGKTNNLSCDIKGSGDMKMQDFECENCSISIYGSGDCKVFVNKALSAVIMGSGDVHYKGNPPEVHREVKGSGDISKY
jgi:putative autotransporter adhesin-like protein